MVLAMNDLATAGNWIRAAIDWHDTGHAPLASRGLESLLEVLEGQLPGQASLLSSWCKASGHRSPELLNAYAG
jgi:hypothetical protein